MRAAALGNAGLTIRCARSAWAVHHFASPNHGVLGQTQKRSRCHTSASSDGRSEGGRGIGLAYSRLSVALSPPNDVTKRKKGGSKCMRPCFTWAYAQGGSEVGDRGRPEVGSEVDPGRQRWVRGASRHRTGVVERPFMVGNGPASAAFRESFLSRSRERLKQAKNRRLVQASPLCLSCVSPASGTASFVLVFLLGPCIRLA
jgi:hypothetical protein